MDRPRQLLSRRAAIRAVAGSAATTATVLASPAFAAPKASGLKLSMSASADGDYTRYVITVDNPAGPNVSQIFLAGSVPAGAVPNQAMTTPPGAFFRGFEGAGPLAAAVWLVQEVPAGVSVGPFIYRVRGHGAAHAFAHWTHPTDGTAVSGTTVLGPIPGRGAALIQAPALPGAPGISSRDRVYTADQTSNTVTVFNPATLSVLGQIALGNPRPDNLLAPIYYGEINTHGMGFSPDGRLLNVIDVTTNSVVLIETATNQIVAKIYVGRAPHEGFFTPDGTQLWVVVRGESYISVIDPAKKREIGRIQTMLGPGMVIFRPDGRYAFVNSSRVPELDVIDTRSHRVVARVPVVSPFSPNIAASPDGKEVWFTHKDIGKVTQLDAQTFTVMNVLPTGNLTNHVNMVTTPAGDFAYVTVGGENATKVFTRGAQPRLVTTIKMGDDPHGLWPSPDNTRVYVALEDGDAIQVIDTAKHEVIATIPGGQAPQALVYVAGAVPTGEGTEGLVQQRVGFPVKKARLVVPNRPFTFLPEALGAVRGDVLARSLGNVDELTVTVSGLPAYAHFAVFLTELPTAPFGTMELVMEFNVDAKGKAMVSAQTEVFKAFAITGQASGGGLDATATRNSRRSLGHVVIWPTDPSTLAPLFAARGLPTVTTPFGPSGVAGPAILSTSNDPNAPSPFSGG